MTSTCEICGLETECARHHVFFGTANRKQSEDWGMVAWLCPACHLRVHSHWPTNLALKQKHQERFMRDYTLDRFMKIFGKNYL